MTLGESGIAPLEWYFDKGPYPVAGAAGAVDATYYQFSVAYDDPYDSTVKATPDLQSIFEMTNMPSYRLDVDMGELDQARIVIDDRPVGQPERSPLRRPDRRLAGRPPGPPAIHAGRRQGGDGRHPDPDPVTAADVRPGPTWS